MERPTSYETTGRAQDLQESIRIDRQILKILFTNNIKFRQISEVVDVLENMLEYVESENSSLTEYT